MNSGLKSAAASGTAATVPEMMRAIGAAARVAEQALRLATTEQKNRALQGAAQALREHHHRILKANELDMQEARERDLSGALLDRLKLDDKRIAAMATGLEDIAALADPIGTLLAEWQRPNGLRIQRIRVPLGVIGIIYESRPNVTADAGALCLKSSNAVILRGGSESTRSSAAIHACLEQGLDAAGLPRSCIQLVPTPTAPPSGSCSPR
jgi:glutamate-5-semialdehyde dehydrogenase